MLPVIPLITGTYSGIYPINHSRITQDILSAIIEEISNGILQKFFKRLLQEFFQGNLYRASCRDVPKDFSKNSSKDYSKYFFMNSSMDSSKNTYKDFPKQCSRNSFTNYSGEFYRDHNWIFFFGIPPLAGLVAVRPQNNSDFSNQNSGQNKLKILKYRHKTSYLKFFLQISGILQRKIFG